VKSEDRRKHATRLIRWHNDGFEFCLVYEDGQLEDASEEDQEAIYKLMQTAKITVSWDD